MDPSYESVMLAKKAGSLAAEAGLPVSLILNKADKDVAGELARSLGDAAIIVTVPDSRDIFMTNLKGQCLDAGTADLEPICRQIEAFSRPGTG